MNRKRFKAKPVKAYYDQEGVKLFHGDSLEVLRKLSDVCIQAVVTSPPYFGLRSYLDDDDPLKVKEIGSESSTDEFLKKMVLIFREVRRVLRDDGVCFVNFGDAYDNGTSSKRNNSKSGNVARWSKEEVIGTNGRITTGAGAGQLLNMPHRVAEALRDDGWIWRQTIIWHKKSPLPESVSGTQWQRHKIKVKGQTSKGGSKHRHDGKRGVDGKPSLSYSGNGAAVKLTEWKNCPGCDKCNKHDGYILRRRSGRCTTAHEYIFMFTKKGSGYFWDAHASQEVGIDSEGTVNPRSVWTISTEPTKIKHFASYPSELVRRCLSGGISAGGCCGCCGMPYAPIIESSRVATRPATNNKIWKKGKKKQRSQDDAKLDPERHVTTTKLKGYRPCCDCGAEKGKQVVLDPFAGILTTGQTAIHLGCDFIGIELNEKYIKAGIKRVHKPPRWWLRKQKKEPKLIDRNNTLPGLLH